MVDLLIIETGNGGDLVLRSDDLVTTEGLESAVYLSHFGGNSWWANALIDTETERFEALTEQLLKTTALNSAGRIRIEQAVLADLSWTSAIRSTKVSVSAAIVATDRIEIEVRIDGQQFSYLWNPDDLFLTYKV